jgi:parallel beta-helix repeat protein
MDIIKKNSPLMIVFAAFFLIFSVTAFSSLYQQYPLHFAIAGTADDEDEGESCVDYGASDNTINIDCDASFADVIQAIDDSSILENSGPGEYILKANLEVDEDATFSMNSNDVNWLKITDAHGIIVEGAILINGVRVTSWDAANDEFVPQNINGTIHRGYVQFADSEGSQIINSEFGYMGYVEPGRRGFDLFGGGAPSHDLLVKGSKFHNMWMGFYSNGAYNITVDGSEYYNNIKYSLDPHTTTHNMSIKNNWIHDNPIGPICSDRCWDITVEGNTIQDTDDVAIFFSRNMTDSVARNNHVINAQTGVLLSESPNNQVYDNIIEGATGEGIRLLNPTIADDGSTTGNMIYNNHISNSDSGIRATNCQNNIVQNTTFSDIDSDEYRLLADSTLKIIGQQFDDTVISGDDEIATGNLVEIVNSGTIDVTEGDSDDEDDDDGDGDSHDTDNEPFRITLTNDDSITINSS